jgi:hypothetical protein
MKITVIPDDPDADVAEILMRLARAPLPTPGAIAAGLRRDVVADDEARLAFEAVAATYRRVLGIRLACLARRLRRELNERTINI